MSMSGVLSAARMGRRAALAALLAAVVAIPSACRETSFAPTGSYSEILLVNEDGLIDPVTADVLRRLRKKITYVIKEEEPFEITLVGAAKLQAFPPYKNIFLLGPMAANTRLGQKIRELLGPGGVEAVLSGRGNLFVKNDTPAPSQLTMILTGADRRSFRDAVERSLSELRPVIEKSIRERLRHHLLEKEQMELTRWYHEKYGFILRLPVLYEMLTERPKFRAIEFLHRQPTRLLAVFWRPWDHELSLADSTALYDLRATYAEEMYEGDYMIPNMIRFGRSELGPYPSIAIEGPWANRSETVGGPFRTDFVYDSDREWIWGVDQLVYAPDFDKHPYMRELRALAETFRYEGALP
jgi:hypothetical protein